MYKKFLSVMLAVMLLVTTPVQVGAEALDNVTPHQTQQEQKVGEKESNKDNKKSERNNLETQETPLTIEEDAKSSEKLEGDMESGMMQADTAGEDASSDLYNGSGEEGTIEDSTEQESEFATRILGIMAYADQFSELTLEDKAFICNNYGIDGAILTELEAKGYSLNDSIEMGLWILNNGFSINEVEILLSIYGDKQKASTAIAVFEHFVESVKESDQPSIKRLFLQGYSVQKIQPAYSISSALGVDVCDIIRKDEMNEEVTSPLYGAMSEEEKVALMEVVEKYHLDLTWLLDYLDTNALTLGEFLELADEGRHAAQGTEGEEVRSQSEEEIDYQKYVSAPFSYKEHGSESISINSGALSYESIDLSLPGKNGLDLNILSRYDSSNASIYKQYYEIRKTSATLYGYIVMGGARAYLIDPWTGKAETRYPSGDIECTQIGYYYFESQANTKMSQWNAKVGGGSISHGTGYKLEYYSYTMEVVDTVSYAINKYNRTDPQTYQEKRYNLGTGWSLGFSSIESDGGQKYLHMSNGSVYLVKLTSIEGDSNLDKYTLKDLRLEIDTTDDVYSNGLVSSVYVLIHKDGKKEYFSQDGRLIGIKDRFNNEIKFEYTADQAYISKITDTVGREINISYETTTTGRKVVVTAPENKTIEYLLEPISGYSNEYKLAKKIDLGKRETVFNYALQNAKFSFFSKSLRDANNYFANLTGVHYPTGAYSKYTYEMGIGNLGDQGTQEYYRIKTREDIESGISYNKDTYSYPGDNHTGYPSQTSPSSLPDTFTYAVTVTDSDNNQVNYTFNHLHLGNREEVKQNGTALISKNQYEYNDNKLRTKVINQIYNQAGQCMERVENYTYDEYGNVTGHWNTKANRHTTTKMPLDDEHKTTYTYDTARYHLMTSKIYKNDASTTILQEFIPNATGKNIEWANVKANGLLKEKTWFSYDTFGNVTEQHRYLEDNNWSNWITVCYNYDDNVASRNGQLNGAYLTSKTIKGIKDADGVGKGDATEVYEYDLYGKAIKKYDAKNLRTSFEYDNLGRIKKIVYPDLNYRRWDYNDLENSVTATDENLNQTKHDYDGLGNLKSVQDVTSGQYLKQYTYDHKMRLKTEKNAQGLNSSHMVEIFYRKDGRLEVKQVTNKEGVVIYKESYTYDDAAENGSYVKVTKTVHGDASAPSVVTTAYTDKHGQVRKEGRIHNGQELVTTYVYDYLGNKTEEKHARAYAENWTEPYTAKFEYDYAGRLAKQENVEGRYMTSQYDALGRLVSVADMKGNKAAQKYSASYQYDNLNRRIIEKTPFEKIDGTVYYTVKKNFYDMNGNLTLEKVSNHKPGGAESYNQTAYAYNDRNMLTMVTTYRHNGKAENYTQYYYDAVGNKRRMYTGLSHALTISGLDVISSYPDHEYSVTKYDYNQLGQITEMTDPLQQKEIYENDLNGNITGKTDRNGDILKFTYDGMGRIVQKAVVEGGVETPVYSYTYTLTGNSETMTGQGLTYEYFYDDLGRLEREEQSNGIVKKYTYDQNNNRKTFVLKQNGVAKINTGYAYDNMDRLWKVSENSQLVAEYMYDDNGNRETLINHANGTSAHYQYNLANHVTLLTNKRGGTEELSKYQYTYFLNGSQASKSDLLKGKTTRYIYDGVGRLVKESEKMDGLDGVVIYYSYDKYNNRKTMSVVEAGNVKHSTYAYNRNNQLQSETTSTQKVKYVSDMVWESATNGWGSIEKDRSNGEGGTGDGRTITLGGETYTKGLGVHANSEIKYNLEAKYTRFIADIGVDDEVGSAGEVGFMVYRDLVYGDKEILYSTDGIKGSSNVEAISVNVEGVQELDLVVRDLGDASLDHADWAGVFLIPIEDYDITYLSDIDWVSEPVNGWGSVEKDRSNNEWGSQDGNTITLRGRTYEKGLGCHADSEILYDLNGQYSRFVSDVGIDDETNGAGYVKFEVYGDGELLYDSGYVSGSDPIKTLDVNVAGKNQLKLVVDDGDSAYADHADWAGARLETDKPAAVDITSYTYDNNGNQKTKTVNGALVSTSQYDKFNQLESITQDGKTISYTYNGDGLRQTKTVDGVTTTHVWDGDQIVMELDGAGNVTAKYIRGINLIFSEDANGVRNYYHYNAHGDVVQLTDGNGTVMKEYEYDAFGNEKNPDVQDINPFRYCGEYFDKETGTIYLRARYYDPQIGRFITEDSYWGEDVDPLSLNLYTYCHNDPVNAIDPTGHWPEWLDKLMGWGKYSKKNSVDVISGAAPGFTPPPYQPSLWNRPIIQSRTNCYAYAFDLRRNPITGEYFPLGGMQPGMLNGEKLDRSWLSGTKEGNKGLVNAVKADARKIGYQFIEAGSNVPKGAYLVALVIKPKVDYHWYRKNNDGTWSHKPGDAPVSKRIITGVNKSTGNYIYSSEEIRDPKVAGQQSGYTVFVGYFYIVPKKG